MAKWIELNGEKLVNLEAVACVRIGLFGCSIFYDFIGGDDCTIESFGSTEECDKRYEEIKRMLMGGNDNETNPV